MAYRVELTDAAVEGLADLDKGDAREVHKRLKKLEETPELGQPLGKPGRYRFDRLAEAEGL